MYFILNFFLQGGATTSDIRNVACAVGPSGSQQPPQPGQLPMGGMPNTMQQQQLQAQHIQQQQMLQAQQMQHMQQQMQVSIYLLLMPD